MTDWADEIAVTLVWNARNLPTEDCTKLLASALRKIKADTLEEALDCQPSTAANPSEDAYQRGRFHGVIEFYNAISKLKDKP